MSTLSPDWWHALDPYLDKALAMAEEERAAWMATLRQENPALAEQLQKLLQEHRALTQEGFLEKSPTPLPPWSAGQTFGAHTLLSPIGEGGMGTVWLAERNDGRFKRQVAVKFLSIAAVGGEERFKREGSLLGRLEHPHIAQLVDAGVSPTGQSFLVLEYVDGVNIDHYCDRRRLDVEARIRLFLDVLSAVAHAHANLIVHRDIKPSNVLVRSDGQVKLLDFGIAKLLRDDAHASAATWITREGAGALTPQFAAPEQVTGGLVTTATDVYALGLLLYLLLTGRHPTGAEPLSPAEWVKAIADTEPPHPSDVVVTAKVRADVVAANAASRSTTAEKLCHSLRGDLDTIICKALKKDPKERYPSVIALADDLNRYLTHKPIAARPDDFRYRAAKFVRRNRTTVVLASLVFLASVSGVVGTLIQAHAARVQRDFAFRQLSRAEAINDLNSFLLSDAAPSGKPFTVNELLGRAEHIVARQHVNDVSRVELLISIGRQYDTQDEIAKARRLLEEAYRLSRDLPDVSTRAQASCALGAALSRGGEPSRAETLIQEGLRDLPYEPQYLLDRVSCLLRGREVADESGASQVALARVQAARGLLKQSPLQSEMLELRVLMDQAECLRNAGRFLEASATFEQASTRLTSLGRDDTETAGTLFNNWAKALDQLGRPLEAEKIFCRALDISRAGHSEQGISPMLLLNYSGTLQQLNRFDEAADYAERAYAIAQQAGQQVVVNQSLLQRARIYRARHELARSSAMLEEVEPRLRRDLPAGHYAFAVLSSEQSLLSQDRGDLQTASRLSDQAMNLVEAAVKTGRQGGQYLPLLFLRRSSIELQLGHTDAAAADARRSLSSLNETSQPRTHSNLVGRAYLILARALLAQGKSEEARDAARSAAEHFQSTIGADHPDTRSAQQLAEVDSRRP